MLKLGLSTKLLLSMLLVSAALTASSLLFVRRFMQAQVRREIQADLRNSELTFQNLQKQREVTLSRSAELLADLSHTAGSEVVFWYGKQIARSTIAGEHETDLVKQFGDGAFASHSSSDIGLGSERFLSSSVELTPGATQAVHLQILKSYDE